MDPGKSTLLEGMRASDQSIRDAVAVEAGVSSPSTVTWDLTVAAVAERMETMRAGQLLPMRRRRSA